MIKKSNNYETPSVEIMDVVSEGVFCTSEFGIRDWAEDDEEDLYF